MDMKYSLLKKYFGYSTFRPGQEEIIDNILAGNDTLVLMPTGGGKSMCYQIPALMMEGCAFVVSPLIALMNDQVSALRANGISAVAIHSNQDERTNRDYLDAAVAGKIKIVYISPERLTSEIGSIAGRIKISFVAIDEAHCISQWGHDFRPVYTSLRSIKENFPGVPVMALTATADRLTRSDIAAALNLENPFCWIGSFDRPNISLSVMPDPGKKKRLAIISSLISRHHLDSGIVYCLSRKKTEEMHKALLEMGHRSVCYHAGLTPQQREEAQTKFINGDAQVVCATIAFGMGIDKSNIRWVVQNNIPGNIESYYQEIGRAGRDGLPAEAIMFYNFGDIIMRRNFVEESGQKEINGEKLEFMQHYAEASVCRRRILLSYFSEEMKHDCGNCDNCRNPRRRFDGTIPAQKVLSAIIRINAAEGMQTIIDILRASTRADIIRKRYDQIKTYGAGRDMTPFEWQSYILQMIQLGLIEVAYEDNFHLRPTPYGMRVVKGLERIELSAYEGNLYGKSSAKKKAAPEPETILSPEERLLEQLKILRKELADKDNIAPYLVFSDATLSEMVRLKPEDIDDIAAVSGVGKVKLVKFGKDFLGKIRSFNGLKPKIPAGTTRKETLILFNSGMEPAEIARLKGVTESTVFSHLEAWADEDRLSDFRRLVSEKDFLTISKVLNIQSENAFTILKEKMGFQTHQIRMVQAEQRWRERHGL